MNSREQSFTLMELMIVVVIIGVIAGFAIPSYQKAMARQKVKRLILTANLIAGAQEIYKARNGRYWCDFLTSCGVFNPDVSDINMGLGVSIIPEDGTGYVTYAAPGSENTSFRIAISDGVSFLITLLFPENGNNVTCGNISAMNVCP
ncbi:MAG: prepilin-type N-terminal cleavage/methylation domain-containing protein [Candidatus Omnitrophica bacterium]|nr:prepilin-type N-terminal cleavage/methylation domain-containing protein [Candidatus Omnitrophota bacterium]